MRWLVVLLLAFAIGCPKPPVVHVSSPPCDCNCAYSATAPEVGRGCWVEGDRLICPLVRRTLDVEPAYPADDPRCTRDADGQLRCEVQE